MQIRQKVVVRLALECGVVVALAMGSGSVGTRLAAQMASPRAPVAPGPTWDLAKYVWSHTHPRPAPDEKPRLDFDALDTWVGVGRDTDVALSADGRYFAYSIVSVNQQWRRDTVVVQSTRAPAWRLALAGASPGFFAADGKQYVFQQQEQLCFLPVGADAPRCVPGVASHRQPPEGQGEWLAYQLKDSAATLVLQHLPSGRTRRFAGVAGYGFDPTGRWLAVQLKPAAPAAAPGLVLAQLATGRAHRVPSVAGYAFAAAGNAVVVQTATSSGPGPVTGLHYIRLPTGQRTTIWSAPDPQMTLGGYSLDASGTQLVWLVQDRERANALWYWRAGMSQAVRRVTHETAGLAAGLLIQGPPTFTPNGRYIVFALQPRPEPARREPHPEAVKLDVWSYKDSILQSTQLHQVKATTEPARYQATVGTDGGSVLRLETDLEKVKLWEGDFAVVGKIGGIVHGDRFWEKGYRIARYWLVSFKDGTRTLIETKNPGDWPDPGIWFSPGGNYLVYFDAAQQGHYFSYDLRTGKLLNISAGVPAWQLGYESRYLRPRETPARRVGLAGWLAGDAGLLVYDNYDIWQLDLAGRKPPVNLTNGYGRARQIKFMLRGSVLGSGEDGQLGDWRGVPVLPAKTPLLLKAFQVETKQTGVYRKMLGTTGDSEVLYLGSAVLDLVPISSKKINWSRPPIGKPVWVKAAQANVWIVKRQSATDAPNYFLTTDFRTYTRLTDLQPQRRYNWLTAELHNFQQLDGTTSQGVLYKPENFDPAKKYPVVIPFYTRLSDRVHFYPTPDYMRSPVDPMDSPAWLVSHGYLVFTPDIYFTRGQWGPSAVNTLEGAARYLRTLPFVDGQRLGVAGFSNSGRFGYYVLTHSQAFAAMALGGGTTNIISNALSLDRRNGESKLSLGELGTVGTGLGGSLWENKATWLDHTAVLHADKVTSPVLMFHDDDGSAPQAVEMFTALWRLGKPAWWLQYEEGVHGVSNLRDLRDFTIRYTQFWDHYLKGTPAPKWMTEGIPAKLKGIETGLELDTSGRVP